MNENSHFILYIICTKSFSFFLCQKCMQLPMNEHVYKLNEALDNIYLTMSWLNISWELPGYRQLTWYVIPCDLSIINNVTPYEATTVDYVAYCKLQKALSGLILLALQFSPFVCSLYSCIFCISCICFVFVPYALTLPVSGLSFYVNKDMFCSVLTRKLKEKVPLQTCSWKA